MMDRALQGRFDGQRLARWTLILLGLLASVSVGYVARLLQPTAFLVVLAVPLVAVIATHPRIGVYLLVAMTPMEEITLAEGFTLYRLVTAIVVVAWCADLLQRRLHRVPSLPRFTAQHWLLLAFVAFNVASALWAEYPAATVSYTLTLLQLFILYCMIVDEVDSPRRLANLYTLFVFVATLSALLAVAQVLGANLTTTGKHMIWSGFTQAVGLARDPNEFSVYQMIAIVMTLGLAEASRTRSHKVALMAATLLLSLSILVSLSRTGLLILVGMLPVLFVTSRDRKSVGSLAVLIVIGAAVAFRLASQQILARLATFADPNFAAQGYGRVSVWAVGAAAFLKYPLLGLGAGNYLLRFPEIVGLTPWGELVNNPLVPHNVYLGVAAELGVFGLALLILILACSLIPLIRAMRSTYPAKDDPDHVTSLVGSALGMLVVLLIEMLALSTFAKLQWTVLALTIVSLRVRQERGKWGNR